MMPKSNDRVSPDRPDEETPSKRGNRLAIGLLTLAAGAVAIVALTQPDPPPTADSATTTTLVPPTVPTTIAFIAQGEPLRFQTVDLEGIPLAVGETTNGEMVVIRGLVGSRGIEEVEVLASRDGESFEPVAQPTPRGSRVTGARVGATGMYVYGQDPTGAPTVWKSEDGRSWSTSVVDPEGRWQIHSVVATETLLLAFGYSNAMTRMEDAVADRFDGLEVAPGPYSTSGEPTGIIVWAPLGIAVGSFTLEELGLPADLFDSDGTTEARAFTDGVGWFHATIPHPATGAMFAGDNGELWAAAHEDLTTRIYATTNGVDWIERADLGRSGAYMRPWRDGYVAVSQSLELSMSTDGRRWERTSLRDHFTNPREWYSTIAADEGGLAILSNHYTRGIDPGPDSGPPFVDFEREGLLVRVWPELVEIFGDDRSNPLVRLGRWTDGASPSVSYDPGSQVLTIHHGPDHEQLLTFTVDELADLEREADLQTAFPSEEQVLLTSPDGCAWTVQELQLPSRSYTFLIEVVGDRVVLGVGGFYRTGGRGQLWWAQLPDGPRVCPAE